LLSSSKPKSHLWAKLLGQMSLCVALTVDTDLTIVSGIYAAFYRHDM
jgi:hypothetical protein